MSIVVAGDANVLPITCTKRSAVIDTQMGKPVFCEGGGVVEGIRERKGTSR
jgi:hypothetical protein